MNTQKSSANNMKINFHVAIQKTFVHFQVYNGKESQSQFDAFPNQKDIFPDKPLLHPANWFVSAIFQHCEKEAANSLVYLP